MADITLEHIAETIREPSYIAHIRLPLARQAIENEFQKDEFFQNKNPNEFLMINLLKLLQGEDISNEDNEHLEELLVFSVISHDKHQEALKKADEEEKKENAAAFEKFMEEQERENNPLYFAVKDAKNKTIEELKSKMGEMPNIQAIANDKMNTLKEFGEKMSDKTVRTQMLNNLKGSFSDTFKNITESPEAQRAKEAATKATDAAKQTFGKFTSSLGFGSKNKPPAEQGGKKKSKKQIKSKKGGKRKTKKNKSKKNKSKKSKK